MTRMGFKKKQGKSAMEKAADKANPNSNYWRDKADALFSDIVRSIGYCELCRKRGSPRQSDDLQVVGLDVHHLIERGQIGYRYNLLNGVSACKSCHIGHPYYRHRSNNPVCLHGTPEQKEEALARLKVFSPEKYEWYMRHKDIKQRTSQMPYKVIYEWLERDYKEREKEDEQRSI